MPKPSEDFAAAQKPTPSELHNAVIAVLTGKAGKETVKELLDRGADPDTKNSQGFPLLLLVAKDLEFMQMFLDAGADIDITCGGWTTLMRAAYDGKDEIVRFLIKAGASLDHKAKDGRTALQIVQEQIQVMQEHGVSH